MPVIDRINLSIEFSSMFDFEKQPEGMNGNLRENRRDLACV
jgi:hypothetical protein